MSLSHFIALKVFVFVYDSSVDSTEGEISSDLDQTKKMMENLNTIQISNLAFDCSWLMAPYDTSINALAQLNGPSLLNYIGFKNVTLWHDS